VPLHTEHHLIISCRVYTAIKREKNRYPFRSNVYFLLNKVLVIGVCLRSRTK